MGISTGGVSDNSSIPDGSVTTAKIANDAVTYAKIQNVSATDKLLGRSTAGAGDVEEITCTAAGRALLDDASASAQLTTLGAASYTDWTTFTPTVTLTGGSGNTVPVYTTNVGRYIQIGKLVVVDIRLVGDGGDEGAGTGRINIAVPIAAGTNQQGGQMTCGTVQIPAGVTLLSASIAAGASVLLCSYISSGFYTNLTGADQSNTTRDIRIKYFYEVD
jgi:hypothetical protein